MNRDESLLLDAAAYLYITDTLARDVEARRQQYWANCEANEQRLLIALFNHYRQQYPDHAASWYAEKEFSEGYLSRLTGYIRGTYMQLATALSLGLLGMFLGILNAADTPADGSKGFGVCLAIAGLLWFLYALYRNNVIIPNKAVQYIQEQTQQNQFSQDVQAFQIARNGYIEGGW